MKKNFMYAVLFAAALLTGCAGDGGDVTQGSETAAATAERVATLETSMQQSTAKITNVPIEQENTDVAETIKAEGENTSVVPPDSDFWLEMFEIWCSDEVLENGKELGYILGASPAGSSKVFYADIDGDGIKELCYIIDTYHGDCMYVCDYVDNDWKVVDALRLGYYTYLQPNDDGTTSLFVVVATRYVEMLDWYVYNNGVEEEFEFLDEDKLYEEIAQIEDMDEKEEYFHAAIEEALEKYDNLINLYDTPYVMTMLLYEARPLTNESLRTEDFDEEDMRRQLDEFTAEVAQLFQC